jgi:hypothetical protein
VLAQLLQCSQAVAGCSLEQVYYFVHHMSMHGFVDRVYGLLSLVTASAESVCLYHNAESIHVIHCQRVCVSLLIAFCVAAVCRHCRIAAANPDCTLSEYIR